MINEDKGIFQKAGPSFDIEFWRENFIGSVVVAAAVTIDEF